MKFKYLAVLLSVCAAAQEPESPTLFSSSVLNAADYSLALVQEDRVFGGIARGSIFLLQGVALGPEELVVAQAPYPLQLPDVEGGSRLEVRSLVSEEVFNAPLIHSWRYQVAAILPSSVPEGLAEVRVLRGALASGAVRMMVLASRPGIFVLGRLPGGPAAAQVYRSPTEQPVISLTGPARPGDTVTLWATGLGPIEGDDNAPPVGTLRDDVRIRIGEIDVIPDYAGRAPGQPGLDQINFRLPDQADLPDHDLPNHCYVPLSVVVGDQAYGAATLSLGAATGPCAHPWELPEEKLRSLDEGERVHVVDLRFQQNRLRRTETDPIVDVGSVEAWISASNATAVASLSPRYGQQRPAWNGPLEGCAVAQGSGPGGVFAIIGAPRPPDNEPPDLRALDVGEVWLTGPQGEDYRLEHREKGTRRSGRPA